MNNEYRNSGISPVVGVVLLVLIVILISGIFGVLVTEFSPTEEPVTAGVNIDQTNDGVEVKWISPGSADELQIQVNGSDQIKLYDTGQSTKIKTDKGEKITVIGKSEGGNESVITNEDTSRKTSSFGDTEVVSGPMPEGTEVTGTVTVNPPVENAEVQVVHNGVVGRTTTTDVDGEYTVNAPEGSKIRVLVEGFTDPAISNPLYASYEKSYTASGPVNFDFTDTKTTTIDGNSILVSNTVSNPSSSEKQIGLTEQLSSIRTAPDDSYKLIRDIDASKTNSWNSGFDPILDCTGGDTTLDGNGHKISNLTITNSSDCTGLFGSMGSNGAIKDITLEDISVTGEKYTGGLIGENNGGDVSNVNVGGSISGEDQTGGLIGNNSGSITEVQVDADVSGDAYTGGVFGVNYDVVSESNSAGETSGEKLVGGIVGYNSGTVEDTSATGKVTASQSWVGGLIGQSNGTITNSYSESSVTGSNQVGGLVGRLHSSSSSLSGSYATGTVNGSGNFVGGLVGYSQGSITDAYSEGETNANKYVGGLVGYSTSDLSNVHSSSNVEADSLFAGGLVGYSTAKISDSYAEGTVKSDSWAGGLVANAKDDIENSHATGNIEASTLAGGLIAKTNSSVSNSYATGDVTLTGPRAGGLIGETRNPVGEPTPTVTDSYAEGTVTGDDDVGGLIGRSNSDINNSHATGNVSGDSTDIGGLLGSASNNINNSHATGTVEGGTNVGGLIGRYNGGTIDTSYAEGSVSADADYAGGLVGKLTGNAKQSYATGNVSRNTYVGGFAGIARLDYTVTESYATGDVTATNKYGGGFTGISNTQIEDSYTTGSVTGGTNIGSFSGQIGPDSGTLHADLSNIYATGSVSGTNTAGITPKITDTPTTTNLYWNTETAVSNSQTGTGLTTSEMQGSSASSNMTGFDFTNTWQTNPNDYPTLQNNTE